MNLPDQFLANVDEQNELFYGNLPYKTLIDKNFLKQGFWPELWIKETVTRTSDKQLDAFFQTVVSNVELKKDLNALLPCSNDEMFRLMTRTGWHQALGAMATKYTANIKVHVCRNIFKRSVQYLRRRHPECYGDKTITRIAHDVLTKPLRPWTMIPQECFEDIAIVRAAMNQKVCGYLPKDIELTSSVFALHMYLSTRDDPGFSVFPFMTLSRKFAYIDSKISQYMFGSPDFREILKISDDHLRARGTFVRRCRRQKARRSGNRKLKQRRRRVGKPKYVAKGATMQSIETDGISLCMTWKREKTRHRVKSCDFTGCLSGREVGDNDSNFVGIDEGRAKIVTASFQTGDVVMLKRRHYKFRTRFKVRESWEQRRNQNNAGLRFAMAALSQGGGWKNSSLETWIAMTKVLTQQRNVLYREYVEYDGRALWSMRHYRWKKSLFDRLSRDIIRNGQPNTDCGHYVKPDSVRNVYVGVGNANFPATGPGETAVPTREFGRSLVRMKRMVSPDSMIQINVLSVDEFRTTMLCRKCKGVMDKIRISKETENVRYRTRYRCCLKCRDANNNPLRVDRDVNASGNILDLMMLILNGQGCPREFSRSVSFQTLVGFQRASAPCGHQAL